MQTEVTFRHLDASEALKTHTLEKLSKLQKYVAEPGRAHATLSLSTHKNLKKPHVEISISSHKMHINSKAHESDMYAAIDSAILKLERQAEKYHSKMVSHRSKASGKRFNSKLLEKNGVSSSENNGTHNVIETQEFDAHVMMLDEAILEIGETNKDFITFLNPKTDKINVLFRTEDNKLCLIEAK